MTSPAMAREDLQLLRQTIAKIEKKQIATFDSPVSMQAKSHQKAELHHNSDTVSYPLQSDHLKKKSRVHPFGYHPLDHIIGGGLPCSALTEFRCDETREAGGASAFVWILAQRLQAFLSTFHHGTNHAPIIWISQVSSRLEGGGIYPHGLLSLGVDPSKCLFIQPKSLNDALWAAELAAKHSSIAATIFEVRGNPSQLDMAGTRRLHLRAQAAGRPFFLLRQTGYAEATAARLRFRIQPAAAGMKTLPSQIELPKMIGNPSFQITLEKSKNPSSKSFILEWKNDIQSFKFATKRDGDIQSSDNPKTSRNNGSNVYQAGPENSGAYISPSFNGSDSSDEMGRIVAFR